jgi:hypothetical protein
MTTSNFALVLRRAHEHLIASAAAIALTAILLVSVNAHAATRALTPSVTILVPTVTIEALSQ